MKLPLFWKNLHNFTEWSHPPYIKLGKWPIQCYILIVYNTKTFAVLFKIQPSFSLCSAGMFSCKMDCWGWREQSEKAALTFLPDTSIVTSTVGKLGHKCISTCHWEENPVRVGDQKRVILRFMIQISSLFISIKDCRWCYNEKLKHSLQNTFELTLCQPQSLPDLQNEAELWCSLHSSQRLRQTRFAQKCDRGRTY